jgi:hypothetical protein
MSDHCREDAFDVPDGLTLDVKISVCQVKREYFTSNSQDNSPLPKECHSISPVLGIPNVNAEDLFQWGSF